MTKYAIAAAQVDMTVKVGNQSLEILKSINWQIQQGDLQLLMGRSGSGKTTLLSVLAGLLTPTAGKVWLLDTEITSLSRDRLAKFRRQHLGFIFQDFNLFPSLTALENLLTTFDLKGIKGKNAQGATDLLSQVGLQDKLHQLPQQLSGGEKQRVAIARALVGNPQLILADEPTASLDSQSGHGVMTILAQLAKQHQTTVLIVTHDPRITDLADRIAYLEDGVLQAK
ncbi:MAG: ABC transporter ATP-binding protein [Pseudanabaenaceae cyanobacterium bins.68]|nr:ABC transporter ATP-binding protein [Pseudanabaenaceae cyanobacterium bins.68]